MLSCSSFREEGVEGVVASTNGLIGGHLAIRLDAMLETEELPAGVAYLDAGLANVDGNDFSHCDVKEVTVKKVKIGWIINLYFDPLLL